MTKNFTMIISGALLAFSLAALSPAATAGGMLADRHGERGIACASCHGNNPPAPGAKVDQKACLACHGSLDKVAERTKAKKLDPDPHYNHLVGLDCLECHRGHQQSVNMCGSCHNLEFKVP
ncbi:cytochrome c3 family protein [Sutterella sp.]|uniref:cytochrome c3 family protein n=1 Tax=Sutterella sp. TaxID=1981025 RepID=UPI0026E0370D|nr:cytochrome c3 family protein [Sutterella sp.]MDO5532952.1 cytochrome c3 family protein [Sutterella sp.]